MRLAGFNFDKISVERLGGTMKDVKISSNIEIVGIKELEAKLIDVGGKLLTVTFSYGLNYDPNFAKVEFKGTMIVSLEEKIAKEILEKWEKKETVKDFKLAVLNVIFKKCNVRALQLEEELNLPLHLSLASLKPSN